MMIGLGADLTGWSLSIAWDISDDGRTIFGWGSNPSGDAEAWVAVIPEPSAALVFVCGFVVVAVAQRRRHRRGKPRGADLERQ